MEEVVPYDVHVILNCQNLVRLRSMLHLYPCASTEKGYVPSDGCLRAAFCAFRSVSMHLAEDKKKLIDTHYGAIAAKAVMLKPKDLVVQEKSQEEFEKMLPGWAGLMS